MSARPLLRVLPSPHDRVPDVRFCGYCGARPEADDDRRVCGSCDMGMVLTASAAVAPQSGQPSIVIDDRLTVCAVSRAAEELLGISEDEVLNRRLVDVLAPAQAEGVGLDSLVSAVVTAVSPDSAPQRAVVRPAGEWGIRYAVRIGVCGPPRAALLVLDDDQV
ncbi:MAG: hypothetical protein JWO02_697 [Solirubrobacterales bacterium]|nr:hypothetical protein [Solirubrobacterales bacterium]